MKPMNAPHKMKQCLPAFICSLLLLGYSEGAQQRAEQAQQSSNPQPAPAVRLSVIVTDGQNRAVSGLRQEDFQVLEDGVPQTISFFSSEELPVTYGFVIDNTGSLQRQIEQVVGAGRLLLRNKRPNDEAFIVRFTSSNNLEVVR